MEKDIIKLVSLYMQGNIGPLGAAALDAIQEDNFELAMVKRYAEAAVNLLKKTMPKDHHISGFDGEHISVQCSCPEHPPQLIPVKENFAWLPKKSKEREWHHFPSLFAVAPATKVAVCRHCISERENSAILMRPVCRYHPEVLLKAGLVCSECASGANLLSIDGRSITLVHRGAVTSTYECPIHSTYSVGHRAKNHGCPTCGSYKGIIDHAATLKRRDIAEIRRIKAIAAGMIKKHLRKVTMHSALTAHQRLMIKELVMRCYDPEKNMHLLSIFPTEKFIFGEWLAGQEQPLALPASMKEYLMPHPNALVQMSIDDDVTLMDDATVVCDITWRTAHWSRHKEYV